MAITTLLFFRVLVDRWRWSTAKALAVTVPLLLVDLAFLAANIPKIPHGGWFPLVVGLGPRGPDDDVAARSGHRRPHAAAGLPTDRRRRRRGAPARRGAGAGHGGLHVQGPRLRATGAAVEPPPQPRPARAHRHRVGRDVRRAARASPTSASTVTPIAAGRAAGRGDVRLHRRARRGRRAAPASGSTACRSTSTRRRSSSGARPSRRSPRARCRGGASTCSSCSTGAPPAPSRFYHLPSSQVFEVGTQVEI